MGLYFRKVAGVAQVAKSFGPAESMKGVYEGAVRKTFQAVFSIYLEKIRILLSDKRPCCYSIVFDASKPHDYSFDDVRVYVCVNATIDNFHLLDFFGSGILHRRELLRPRHLNSIYHLWQ